MPKLSELDRQVVVDAYSNIAFFSCFLYFDSYVPSNVPKFHRELYSHYASTNKFLGVVCPRGHAKSMTAIVVYACHSILYRNAKFILVISNSYSKAELHTNNLKTELEHNPRIHHYYGAQKTEKWANGDFETLSGAKVMAVGANQAIRGLMWRGTRPDLIIVDDLEDDELVANKERRDKLSRWFYASVLPMLSDNGKLIINGTIIHWDSIMLRLKNDPQFKFLHYQAADDNLENPIWLTKFPTNRLKEIRDSYEQQGHLDVFYQEYLSQAISPKDAPFKREDFRYYELIPAGKSKSELPEAIDPKELRRFIGLDSALSKDDRACYTAVSAVGFDMRGKLYILEYVRARLDIGELVEAVMRMVYKWNPISICGEKVAIEQAIGYNLKEEMNRCGKHVPIVLTRPNKDKVNRILSLSPLVRSHRFFMLNTMGELEDEMYKMSRTSTGPYCDILDSIEDVLQAQENVLTIPEDDAESDYRTPERLVNYKDKNEEEFSGIEERLANW